MRSKHVIVAPILLLIASLFYITLGPRRTSPKRETTRPINVTESSAVYTPIPVEDDEETEMGVYSARVKTRIRDIKRHLVYRPPMSILPFVRMMGHYIAAPNYKLANCVVEKSMCTQMNGILCYLYDTDGFVTNNRSIQTETWQDTFCDGKNGYNSWKELQIKVPERLETTFIVREPLERFVSAYIDKCVHEKQECYGCYKNVTCLVERVFESMMMLSEKHSQINDRDDMVLEMSYEGRHFAPMTWYCDLWDRYEEYHFIKYGEDDGSFNKTRQAVLNFFEKQEVESGKIEYIEEALNSRSSHATKTNYSGLRNKTWKLLLNSHKHMEMLSHIYYYDYIAFGFNSPVDIYYPYS